MSAVAPVYVGLLGVGTVGSGVAQALVAKQASIGELVGCPVVLKRALVQDTAKRRATALEANVLTTDAAMIMDDPAIAVVIELMGGEEPAYSLIKTALGKGKHVVTANKEVIAKHGPSLVMFGEEHGAALRFEASVGGGIPLIAPFRHSLLANDVSSVHAIINGTTNYILTKMSREQLELAAVLKEAQDLGYAEPDPSYDIEGDDAAFKLAILASLAFRTRVAPGQVFREGITNLSARDFRYAGELGYAIKLLATAKQRSGVVEARVHPTMISEDRILAKVDGVFNAVEVNGDLTGRVMFYGQGAGSLPTTSAVVADLIELARAVHLGLPSTPVFQPQRDLLVIPMDEIETRYYVRMTVGDKPGVLAQIAHILGDCDISIASVIQKESDAAAQVAEIVLMTHLAQESAMQRALAGIARMASVRDIGTVIRVED